MIVSGFTQRKHTTMDDELTPPGQHSHCYRCRKVNCSVYADEVSACVMSNCESCGWRCHSCKMLEHGHSCPEARVPCVNVEYGCPHTVKRARMSSHLPVCPASVVHCSEEWSRWPMHSTDKGTRASLPSTKTYIDCGQLDVSLAMRDQRMLIESLRAPRKQRRTLRNHLTQKYPAVPFPYRSPSMDSETAQSEDTATTLSDDESGAPWDLSKPHPGLEESMKSRLLQVTREVSDSVVAALEASASNTPGHSYETLGSHSKSASRSLSPEPSPDGTNKQDLSGRGPSAFEMTKKAMQKIENASDLSNIESPNRPSVERSVRSSVSSDRYSQGHSRSRSRSVIRDVGGTQLSKLIGKEDGNEGGSEEICLNKILGLNINVECINKYISKPPSMYSFMCAQNFRRDQYSWHHRNVHQEIHQGFSGMLEQRCPLAYLGCPFSFIRMTPSQPNTTLYHSWLQESFGLKSNIMPTLPDDLTESDKQVNEFKEVRHKQPSEPPSLYNLGEIDRKFDQISNSNFNNDSTNCDTDFNNRFASAKISDSNSGDCLSVQPIIYTGHNLDSKVLFEYTVEPVEEVCQHSLTRLPFEILQCIAGQLDSFSLCNLSLTCHTLREVCSSLLEDHGIVLLTWEKQRPGTQSFWQVTGKRWMFSTSFEPIKSWRFTDDHITITEHLLTCQFNQDKVDHSANEQFRMETL